MAKRVVPIFLMAFLGVFATLPAMGLPATPHAIVEGDVKAKLKEVEVNPKLLEVALKNGAKVAGFCANCHGDGGNSAKPDVPNLAGQNATYLMEQMHNYIGGQRPTTDFKRRLIKVLSIDEKVSLVAFYARQEVHSNTTADPSLVNKGKGLYKKLCSGCHEADGKGSEDYSRVAGQQALYMSNAIKSYRDKPEPRLNSDMVASIKPMSDADIAALVAFISSMK